MPYAPVKMFTIHNGELGSIDTLAIMKRLINDGAKNPLVRQFTANLIRNLPQKDYYGEIETIHNFVRDNIRYTRDPRKVEALHAPEFILRAGYGDCDDKTILVCSMLESIGHKTRMVIVGPGAIGYCHVYAEVNLRGEWLPVECTEPVQLGWAAPGMNNRYVMDV